MFKDILLVSCFRLGGKLHMYVLEEEDNPPCLVAGDFLCCSGPFF